MIDPAWAAFIRRDWRIARSYRFPFAAGLVANILSIAVFYFLSRIVRAHDLPAGGGRAEGYFSFALVGLVLVNLLGIGVYQVANRMREELLAGTLEIVAATPVPNWLMAVGNASYDLTYGVAAGAILVAIAVLVFGASFSIHLVEIPALLLAASVTLVLIAALGVAVAAFTIVFKQAAALAGFITTAVAIVSGVYYPAGVLPQPLRAISWGSPFRWSLDVLRPAVFGHHVPLGELAALVGVTLLAVPACLWLFAFAMQRAKRKGSLAQY